MIKDVNSQIQSGEEAFLFWSKHLSYIPLVMVKENFMTCEKSSIMIFSKEQMN